MKKVNSSTFRFILLCILFVSFNLKTARERYRDDFDHVLMSDARGYYNYLPYTFIYHDVLHQEYAWPLPNGYTQNKYTYGVALLESPFFFAAHSIALLSGDKADGYTPIYGWAVLIAANVYLFIGFWLLFVLLKERFGSFLSFLSLAILMWATNLYYYSVVEAGMSHVYSFFCFSAFLFFVDRYYRNFQKKDLFGIAVFYALITLIRPTNGLLLLLYLFYDVYTLAAFKARVLFHLKQLWAVLLFFVVGLVVFAPQLWYWHSISGNFILYSYGDETFKYLKEPKLLQVLAGYKSGWLFYSPVMIYSLAGIVLAWKRKVFSMPVFVPVFLTVFYLCASWWAYTFGAAFGYRSFIEFYALLVFPMALCLETIFKEGKWYFALLTLIFIAGCMYSNLLVSDYYVAMGGCWDGPQWTFAKEMDMLRGAFK